MLADSAYDQLIWPNLFGLHILQMQGKVGECAGTHEGPPAGQNEQPQWQCIQTPQAIQDVWQEQDREGKFTMLCQYMVKGISCSYSWLWSVSANIWAPAHVQDNISLWHESCLFMRVSCMLCKINIRWRLDATPLVWHWCTCDEGVLGALLK